MTQTLGYHVVKSGYGLWLPGDTRGHWSEAYDDAIGFHHPHTLNPGDPVRNRMAGERQKHPPVRFDAAMRRVAAETLGRCAAESSWTVAAASIEETHTHLVLTYSGLDIYRTVKWLAQRMTKAIHRHTPHTGPVWCEGNWVTFLFDSHYWQNTIAYIERHNIRRGDGPRPYDFITPL